MKENTFFWTNFALKKMRGKTWSRISLTFSRPLPQNTELLFLVKGP